MSPSECGRRAGTTGGGTEFARHAKSRTIRAASIDGHVNRLISSNIFRARRTPNESHRPSSYEICSQLASLGPRTLTTRLAIAHFNSHVPTRRARPRRASPRGSLFPCVNARSAYFHSGEVVPLRLDLPAPIASWAVINLTQYPRARNKRPSPSRHVCRKTARQRTAFFHLDDLKQLIRGHYRIAFRAKKIIITGVKIWRVPNRFRPSRAAASASINVFAGNSLNRIRFG